MQVLGECFEFIDAVELACKQPVLWLSVEVFEVSYRKCLAVLVALILFRAIMIVLRFNTDVS